MNKHNKSLSLLFLSITAFFVCLAAVFIAGCGGDGDSASPVQEDEAPAVIMEGVFLDSAVEGLEYRTDTRFGITGSGGGFKYAENESITFSIGDVVLGDATGISFITPVELVEGASDETHPEVINICRFLLTLDDDDQPENGILITESVRDCAAGMTINFTSEIADFETDPLVTQSLDSLTAFRSAGQRSLIEKEIAQEHLYDTLCDLDNDMDGYTENQGDCNDASADINPGVSEICGDGIDQDCSGSDASCFPETETGTLSVSLSLSGASPPEYAAIYMTVKTLRIHFNDGTSGILNTPVKTYNLLELVNGNKAQLAAEAMPPGEYAGIELIIGDVADNNLNLLNDKHPYANYFIDDSGEVNELEILPNYQFDILMAYDFTVSTGRTTDLFLDLDSSESILNTGQGRVWLNAVFSADLSADPADADGDSDGYTENQGDCDDMNSAFNPGKTDWCEDGMDQDCSGSDAACTDDPDIDDDGDGYTENQGDCNDRDSNIHPGATEICADGIDNDCDGKDVVSGNCSPSLVGAGGG